jgi:hypothetical protein
MKLLSFFVLSAFLMLHFFQMEGSYVQEMCSNTSSIVTSIIHSPFFGYGFTATFLCIESCIEAKWHGFFLHEDGTVFLHKSLEKNRNAINNARLHTQLLCVIKTITFLFFEYQYYKNNSFFKSRRRFSGDMLGLLFVLKTFSLFM